MTAINMLRSRFKFDKNSPWSFYRRVVLYSFIVSLCLTVPFVIVEFVKTGSGVFLYYGDYNAQQICFYRHCVDMVHSGNFGWDWNTDMGSNFIGSYSYYMLGSPFFWLICCFPSSWTPYLMAPMYVVKYIVAAVLAYAYLQRFVKNKNYAIVGALLYSFSGFQIYNTFFNQFHDVVAFFPLLLIGMEELVQNDRKGIFALAVMINAMINYFMFAGQVVFCVIYFLFRATDKTFDITLKKLLWLALEAVMGFMMSMFMFLPAASALMGNSRIERSYTGTLGEFFTNLYKYIFKGGKWADVVEKFKSLFIYRNKGEFYWQRYGQIFESYVFPPDIPSRVNFFDGHATRWASISMYLPMVGLNGVFAVFTVKGRKWLKKIMTFLVVCSFVPLLNSIFFLFNSSYYARWLYMMIIMFCLATTVALEDRRTNWHIPAYISTFVCALIAFPLGLIWFKKDSSYTLGYPPYILRFWIYVAIGFIGTAVTAFIIRKYRGTKIFEKALIAGVCCMTVLYGCIHITNGKMYSSDSNFLVDQAIKGNERIKLPDPHEEFYRIDFYRTSKVSTLDNLGIYWEYPSIECFHTVVPPSIMDFYPKIGVTRDVGSRAESKLYGLRGFTSTKYSFIRTKTNAREEIPESSVNSETGEVEYSTSITEKHDAYGFEYYGTQNEFDIYENEYYIPMGFSYDEFMTETDFENAYKKAERHALLCTYLVVPDDKADYYSKILTRISGSSGVASATKATYAASVSARKAEACDKFEYSSKGFDAHYVSEKTRIVFFSVPYEENGWSVTVNGEEKEVLKLFYGFVGVEVPEGESDIHFTYHTPGLAVGCNITVAEKQFKIPAGLYISLIGLFAYVVYMLIFKVKLKQKAKVKFFAFDYCDEMGAYDEPEDIKAKQPEADVIEVTEVTEITEIAEETEEAGEETEETVEEADEAEENGEEEEKDPEEN